MPTTRNLDPVTGCDSRPMVITQTETKWTKWYAMTSHVIAYRSLELLFGTHAFNFNCFIEDLNCVFTQIRCLSRVLPVIVDLPYTPMTNSTGCQIVHLDHQNAKVLSSKFNPFELSEIERFP